MLFNLAAVRADLRAQAEASPMFRSLPTELLSVGADAKTSKGVKLGYRTAILYLTPSDMSGVNVCPMARKAGCEAACLYSAGRGAFSSVQLARLRKTLYFLQYRADFLDTLRHNIRRFVAQCERDGVTPLVRLNGTSDIQWETVAPELFAEFHNVQFYDYTKVPNRRTPPNYDLTFSYSGRPEFAPIVARATARGMRQAVVFMRREDIPKQFNGMQTVDGDGTDVRHADPQGVVVALYAKGSARRDTSGFVVRAGG
jgi:hypothetical protein